MSIYHCNLKRLLFSVGSIMIYHYAESNFRLLTQLTTNIRRHVDLLGQSISLNPRCVKLVVS